MVALAVRIAAADVGKYMPDPPVILVPDSCRMRVLTRVTVCMTDSSLVYKMTQSPAFKRYDLFAIEPGSEKVMNQVTSGSLDCDILTFDYTDRLPVDLKRANLTTPRIRGVCFEICFGHAFASQSARTATISSGQLLVEKTRCKSVILSSGSRSPAGLRGPYDVAALGLLFGMREHTAKEAAFTTAQACIIHGDARRNAATLAVSEGSDMDPRDRLIARKLAAVATLSSAADGQLQGKQQQPVRFTTTSRVPRGKDSSAAVEAAVGDPGSQLQPPVKRSKKGRDANGPAEPVERRRKQ